MTYQVISPEGSVETFRTQPGFQHSPFVLQVRISPAQRKRLDKIGLMTTAPEATSFRSLRFHTIKSEEYNPNVCPCCQTGV